MLECKFTTQDQRCPWVSASINNRLGSSIWAVIISARYCFVYFGSRMETLLHFARRRKLFIEEGEWCCAEEYTQYKTRVAWCGTTEYPVSLASICFLQMWFCGIHGSYAGFSSRAVIFPRCSYAPAKKRYIRQDQGVWGTDSLAGLVAAPAIALPLEGWVSRS